MTRAPRGWEEAAGEEEAVAAEKGSLEGGVGEAVRWRRHRAAPAAAGRRRWEMVAEGEDAAVAAGKV